MSDETIKKKYASIFDKSWHTPPLTNVALKSYTSFGCYGKADVLLAVNNRQELRDFLKLAQQFKYNWFIIGRGSNCIFIDECLTGVLLVLRGEFKKIVINELEKTASCGAACFNALVARNLRKLSWKGGEFLNTIPGTIGGGLTMNAGAFGSEFKDITVKVSVIDEKGVVQSFDNKSCQFGYRTSVFLNKKLTILNAELKFSRGKKDEILELEAYFLKKRKTSQPLAAATWGSVFMNPINKSAGNLIERCGLKGKVIGGAKISEKHANFIENLGSAKYDDIKLLVDLMRNEVFKKFNIKLKPEGRCIDKYGVEVKIF